ncbi:MAG: universal stress protein [Ilumatobacter sp.]
MSRQLIVPIDGSDDSWRAFDVALALGRRMGASVLLAEVATDPVDGRYARARLDREMQLRSPFDTKVTVEVRLASDSVADELATLLAAHPSSIFVMSSHGKGRSAAVLGSVTERLLRQVFGPMVLVGRNVEPGDLTGPVIVSVDGSHESEVALPLAADWAHRFRTTPWIVNVATPPDAESLDGTDSLESAHLEHLARDLTESSGRRAEFDELHGRHPARAIADYAARHQASMIVASSHGRSGLSRLAIGSVTAALVRSATCPVVVIRLPHPEHGLAPEWMWSGG